MPKFLGETDFAHDASEPLGVLLCNLGTPEAPTAKALKTYLREFLGDPRVVEMARPLWWLILNGIILNTRPRRSAALYERVWTEDGSPLLIITRRIAEALQNSLSERASGPVKVAMAMRYGNPSIRAGLRELKEAGCRRVLVLPLYPQYSATTTASVFDAVVDELKGWRWLPELRFVNAYHDHPEFIKALAKQVDVHWSAHGRAKRMLFSFHGIPKDYFMAGDPYHCHCRKTARLLAEELNLDEDAWHVSFQSRVGPKEWLKPYTDHTLKAWGKSKLESVEVICPGFAADCLETLDEIGRENRDEFQEAGGGEFRYIPALNDTPEHIQALGSIAMEHMCGWPGLDAAWNEESDERERGARRERAVAQGAKQ
ncbi:MAG: ferrochelatase [Gammaproteobacteria bacterium]